MYFAKYWYDQNKLTDKEWDKARMEAGEELWEKKVLLQSLN
jgi:hypothetical protein